MDLGLLLLLVQLFMTEREGATATLSLVSATGMILAGCEVEEQLV